MKENGSDANLLQTLAFFILKLNPLFSRYKDEEIKTLVQLLEKIEYPANQVVVKEGDLSGDIYFVVDGQLKILENQHNKQKKLGTLGPGDCIGISTEGFYSQTGLRTATVMTVTPSILFYLKLDKMLEFLHRFPNIYEDMCETADLMMRAQFIKSAAIFSSLSSQAAQELSRNIEVCHIEPNTILFEEGKMGDKCYLVHSGELEVIVKHDGEERVVSTLSPPMLFGETSLLTESPRNATIRSITECELFVLGREQFLNIVKAEPKIQASLSPLIIERSRPKKNPDVKINFQKSADGELIAILKNESNYTYYRLSRVGLFIWQLLDGKTTLQEITTLLFEDFLVYSPQTVTQLVTDLHAQNFISIHSATDLKLTHDVTQLSWVKRQLLHLTEIMEYQYSFKAVDNMMSKIYQYGGYLLCTLPAQFIFISTMLIGVIAFIDLTPSALMVVKEVSWFPVIISLMLLSFISIFLHEMSHALATKAFGFEVHRFGIGWYWVTGIAFTDTSDMWLSSRGPRTIVNIAGIYSDLVLAGIAACAALLVTNPTVLFLLWLFALSQYIATLKNLDPTLEFDGYYILFDLVDKPNLRESSVIWLGNLFSRKNGKKTNWKDHKSEILYWIVCVLFLILSVQVVVFLQKHVTAIFFPTIASSPWYHYFTQYGIPIIVVIFASLGIWAEIGKQQSKKISFFEKGEK